ncbi:MFS transporter [Lederbergia sp. NSJ-179]|uniref:CynX/NimT family MFS transporter n=1 Tax=Lederbergia sp. NSJ-179 TaxID=2931402 RepID=UPI001FD37D90|nr:MFS transporter [Lederbergia sp. NSJ-179]MCJ7842458.1 MFS transporter [Lederbergia sp. NSJ-179]
MNKNSASLENTSINNAHWLVLLGIILVGANLRAPLTSVGSLISFIRDDLGLSHAVAGSITTLPLLAFAFLSPFAPKLANRFGMEKTIFFSLLFLTIGLTIRSLVGAGFLFTGTMMIGMAIAIGNVLLPGFIKMNFPLKIGMMTGVYAVFMNLFGALGSGLSVPIASIKGIGWKGSLAFWTILSVIALLFWIPQLWKKSESVKTTEAIAQKGKSIWRSPLAWNITIFMGLQSLIFYTMITWLPEILQSHGYSSGAAGWMLFLMQFALIPITFIIPVMAEKMENQRFFAALTAIFFMAGIVGIFLGSKPFIAISVILIGMAAGSAFSLSMMFFSLRTENGQEAAEMSGMAQSFGYLLAAIGPVLFGGLHDLFHGWKIPLLLLFLLSMIILIAGVEAGKNKVISASPLKEKKAG